MRGSVVEMSELEADYVSPFLVSVIVPAFNEEENIPTCVQELSDATRRAGYKSEIIVVNDGSTDNTLSVSRSIQGKCSMLRVLDLGRNYGKATALREGVRASKGDVIAFFDADMQYSPEDLVRLVESAKDGIDIVTGRRDYRFYEQSRTVLSKTYNTVLKLIFKITVNDSNCGMKVIMRRAADPSIMFRYGVPLMAPLLRAKGFKFEEVMVSLRKRKSGKSKFFKDGSFLGGWNHMREISFHSVALLALIANLTIELLWKRLQRFSIANPLEFLHMLYSKEGLDLERRE